MPNLISEKPNHQAGITLLMSILIMATLIIITLTVTFFAIQELRQSRANALSEPSIVAAETGGEQGVWLLKRSTFTDSCPADGVYQIDGTTAADSRVRQAKCISYGAATLNLDPGRELAFFLYDPANINGNVCMEGNPPACDGAQLYNSIILEFLTGNMAVTATAVTLDGVAVGSAVVSSGITSASIPIPVDIAGSFDERIKVTLTSNDHASVRVNTTGSIGGMPDFPTIDAEGCSAHANVPDCNEEAEVFKRRINVTVPL
jgi:hypothetical protein